MHSNVLHWSRGIVVFIAMMMWGIPVAVASTWSDYMDQATAILDSTNQKLNARVNPAANRSVKFTVEVFKSGGIKEVVVITSSGDPNLDATTVDWVMAVEKLPPPSTSVYLRQFFTPLTFTYAFTPVVTGKGAGGQRPQAPGEPVSLLAEPIAPPQPGADKSVAPDKRPVPDKQVVKLQQDLIAKGYNPGPVDGFYGVNTARAIRDFQADQGVDVDGRVSEQLIALVANATPRQQSDNADPVPESAEADSRNTPGSPAPATFSLDRELVEDYYYEEDKPVQAYDF